MFSFKSFDFLRFHHSRGFSVLLMITSSVYLLISTWGYVEAERSSYDLSLALSNTAHIPAQDGLFSSEGPNASTSFID